MSMWSFSIPNLSVALCTSADVMIDYDAGLPPLLICLPLLLIVLLWTVVNALRPTWEIDRTKTGVTPAQFRTLEDGFRNTTIPTWNEFVSCASEN